MTTNEGSTKQGVETCGLGETAGQGLISFCSGAGGSYKYKLDYT